MGMFSWCCKRCGDPVAAEGFTDKVNEWLSDSVVLNRMGEPKVSGIYDGYGRVDGCDIFDGFEEPEIYHLACFQVHGATETREASGYDDTQGGAFGELPERPKPQKADK